MKTTLITETHPRPVVGGTLVRALLRIEGEVPSDERRVPLNLALVLDRSGSMGGGKLEAVKEAARGLIRRLHPEDVVSVVAFDDRVATVAHPGTAARQTGLVDALMRIQAGGSTNLSGGWLQGRALVHEHHQAEGVNRVILLTDGLANVGVTDTATLVRLTAQARQDGVTTTTLGVGEGFNEDLLTEMADAGGGSSYYIERVDQAGGVFQEEVEGLLSIAAQNVTVSLRPREAVTVAAVHHGYPVEAQEGGTLRLTLGDLYAREPRELLADFLVGDGTTDPEAAGAGPPAEPVPVADLIVEADVWTGAESMERQRIHLPLTYSPAEGAVSHPEVERVFTLLEAARARREAVERGDRGDLSGAAHRLREAAETLQKSAHGDTLLLADAQDLLETAEALEVAEEFQSMDRKYLSTKSRHYSRSRRSAGDRTTRE